MKQNRHVATLYTHPIFTQQSNTHLTHYILKGKKHIICLEETVFLQD